MTNYIDQGLTANCTYTYRVYAYNSAGNSTQYSNEVTVTTRFDSSANICEINIGNQVWSCKNLDVSHYRNGDTIPQVTDPTQWGNLSTGAWCYPLNDSALGATYGKLYNFYALIDSREIAPIGWHVARSYEWAEMIKYIDPNADTTSYIQSQIAGLSLKSSQGWTYGVNGNNSSGFNGLPSGFRWFDGINSVIGEDGMWWSYSMINGNISSVSYNLRAYNDSVQIYSNLDLRYGNSVRLVKD